MAAPSLSETVPVICEFACAYSLAPANNMRIDRIRILYLRLTMMCLPKRLAVCQLCPHGSDHLSPSEPQFLRLSKQVRGDNALVLQFSIPKEKIQRLNRLLWDLLNRFRNF